MANTFKICTAVPLRSNLCIASFWCTQISGQVPNRTVPPYLFLDHLQSKSKMADLPHLPRTSVYINSFRPLNSQLHVVAPGLETLQLTSDSQ